MSSSEAARKLLLGDGTTKPKLEYFNIEGVAEQVRIALSIAEVPFDDVTVAFPDWAAKKPTTKHGQLPELILPSGKIITDSMAMLRLAGEADVTGKLYPQYPKRAEVDSVLGLVGDLSRAWRPALYIGMRPTAFGYPDKKDWPEADVTIEKLRTTFLVNELPRYIGYFVDFIKENGGDFVCGNDLTIADLAAYIQINYFRRGIADHVPKESLDNFPEILAYLARVEGHSGFAAYKASKK